VQIVTRKSKKKRVKIARAVEQKILMHLLIRQPVEIAIWAMIFDVGRVLTWENQRLSLERLLFLIYN